jgi:hypothetical protein
MAIREGTRRQMQLLPSSIEEYVSEEAPVRVYDALIEFRYARVGDIH